MLRKQLLAAAVASVFSVASFAADGTYTAAAQGQVGPVPVTVTVQKGKVTKIEVGANKETVGIGAALLPRSLNASLRRKVWPSTVFRAQPQPATQSKMLLAKRSPKPDSI